MDDYMRTNVPNIYAVGDVVDKIALTPVALMEGMSVAKTLVRGEGLNVDGMSVAKTLVRGEVDWWGWNEGVDEG